MALQPVSDNPFRTMTPADTTGSSGPIQDPGLPVIEIDSNSGFCFGVVNAIGKAESELAGGVELLCLGDIVHNASEVERLRRCGLRTITHDDLEGCTAAACFSAPTANPLRLTGVCRPTATA